MTEDRRQMDPRNRISEGVSRKRLALEARRGVRPGLILIAGLAVAVVAVGYLIVNISQVFGRETYQVRFESRTAFGVFEGFDDVRFRGVPAGTITKIERDGAQIVLVAEVRDKYGPVYKNARAELRPITPLNDVYLDIVDPGTPDAGRADPKVALPESQLSTSVTVPDVLDGFTLDARIGAHRLLDNLGNGMADRGEELRRAFVALAPFVSQAGELADQIAHRERNTRRLVHNANVLLTELASGETDIKRLVSTGAATLGTLQQGSADLDATLREIGPTFTRLQSSLGSVRGVVDTVDRGVESLYPVADRLPGGMRALESLADSLEPAARVLQFPTRADQLPRWLRGVQLIGHDAGRLGTGLKPFIPVLDRTSQALIDCEVELRGFWQWNTSFTKFGDANGPTPRGTLGVNAPAITPGTVRQPEPSCVKGAGTIGGRPATPEDYH